MSSAFTADIYACVNGGCIFNYSIYNGGDEPTTNATWKELTSSGSRQWRGISCTVIGEEIVACANKDHIYLSEDRGDNWRSVTDSIGPKSWTAIDCSDTLDVIVATSTVSDENPLGGYIWMSRDRGITWRIVSEAQEFGSRTRIERTKYGPPCGVSNWSCITISAYGDIIAAAELFGNVWISTDIGETWRNASINARNANGSPTFPLANFSTSDITMSDNGFVIGLVTLPSRQDVGNSFVSKDGGVTWIRFPLNQRLNCVTCSGDGTKFSIGTNDNFIYTSVNNGQTFSQQFSSGINKWSAITIFSETIGEETNSLYLASSYWDFVYVSNDGITWTKTDTSSGRRPWMDLTVSQA